MKALYVPKVMWLVVEGLLTTVGTYEQGLTHRLGSETLKHRQT